MKKKSKVLLALIACAMSVKVFAGGYPVSMVLNSGVGYTLSGGVVYGSSSTVTNTPATLCSSPANCGWVESIAFDTAVGGTVSAQVTLYDAPDVGSISVSPTAYIVDTFNVLTATSTSGSIGSERNFLGSGGRITLDYYVHSRLFVATTTNNPDTITASVLLGKIVDSKFPLTK